MSNPTHPSEPSTITGKPITAPVAFRLPTSDYIRLQDRAAAEGKSVSALLQEWVCERLNDAPPIQPGERVKIIGDHPWAGYIGMYQGEEDTPGGPMHRIELANGTLFQFANFDQLEKVGGPE